MNAFRNTAFNERLNTAADAKKAALEKFRGKPGPDDPAVIERQAARQALSAAREARAAERQVAREAEALREAAEHSARQAEAARQASEQAVLDAKLRGEQTARDEALEAQRKIDRDARYAARKARQR